MNFIKYRKIWYIFSGALVIASIISLFIYGLRLSIDFTGGSLLEVQFLKARNISQNDIKQKLESEFPKDGPFQVQPVSEDQFILRFQSVTEQKHQQILQALKKWFSNTPEDQIDNVKLQDSLNEKRFSSIGPVIGQELKRKALWAMGIVVILIILYIAWAFRRIHDSFKYGVIAIVALIHDILITLGAFSVLHLSVYSSFIAALLTILGYSVNDTIVIFDRIRENLIKAPKQEEFDETVNKSLNQTIRRSLFTSLTTLFVLIAVLLFGGPTIKNFVFALIVGISAGTYSSIFLAAPLLVSFRNKKS